MMYGFGDDQNPYTESVDLLEDLVIEFITQMVGTHALHFHQAYMQKKFTTFKCLLFPDLIKNIKHILD